MLIRQSEISNKTSWDLINDVSSTSHTYYQVTTLKNTIIFFKSQTINTKTNKTNSVSGFHTLNLNLA